MNAANVAQYAWLAVMFGALLFIGCMWVRNRQVYEYRRLVLERIRWAAEDDAHADRDWRWRHEAFRAVTYDQMFWQFWRPLDDFYSPQMWEPVEQRKETAA